MVNPVPGHSVSTAYRKSGPNWGTCGFHTGQDYAAPAGTPVVAARGGEVVYVHYGSAFGGHQFAIRPGDGSEDFYAHCSSRPPSGVQVATGEKVATVGSEGNSTGPHLHLERHASYGWSCYLMADPMLSHNHQAAPQPRPPWEETDAMLLQRKSDKIGVLITGGKAVWVKTGSDYQAMDAGGLPSAVVSDELFGDVIEAMGGAQG